MHLNVTQKLTLTHAVLTLGVLLPAALAIYLVTKTNLLRESRKNADLAAQTTAREILSRLDDDVLLEFGGDAPALRGLRVTAQDWAVVRGIELVEAAGLFAGCEGDRIRQALGSRSLTLSDGKVVLVASLPFPKPLPEPFAGLPPNVQEAARKLWPGGAYLRSNRAAVAGRRVHEIEFLHGDRLIDAYLTDEGKLLIDAERKPLGEVEKLASSLPDAVVEGLLGPEASRAPMKLEWRALDGQLIAVFTLEPEGPRPAVVAVNRYGERFTIGPGGELSGPTSASALKLLVGVDVTHVSGSLVTMLVLGGPLVWVLVVTIGWYVTRRAFAPVERIVSAADRIRPPHLHARLPVGMSDDELSRIAETMNRMLDRLEQGFLREKRFTGDASHELRGPLAKVIAEIDVMLSTARSVREYQEALVRCRGYAGNLKRIVESLLLLARLEQEGFLPQMQVTDVETLVADAIASLPQEDGTRLRLEIEEGRGPIFVRCAGDLISVLARNLIENGLRYSPVGEPVTVRVRRASGTAVIEVEDNGLGIPEGRKDQVFDRFFRLDESRSRDTGGVGLGLAIVRAIARAHGSDVDLRRSPGGQTTIASFRLPIDAWGAEGPAGSLVAPSVCRPEAVSPGGR